VTDTQPTRSRLQLGEKWHPDVAGRAAGAARPARAALRHSPSAVNFAAVAAEGNRVVRPGRLSIALAVVALAGLPVAAANADVGIDVPGVATTTVALPTIDVPGVGTVDVDLAGGHVTLRADSSRPPLVPGGAIGGVVTTPPVSTPPVTTPPVTTPPVSTPPVTTPTISDPPVASAAAVPAEPDAQPAAKPAATPKKPSQAAAPTSASAPAARRARTTPVKRPRRGQPAVITPRTTMTVSAPNHRSTGRPAPRHSKATARSVTSSQGAQSHRASGVSGAIVDVVDRLPGWVAAVFLGFAALAAGMAVNAYAHSRRARRLAVQRAELVDDVGQLQAALLAPLPAARADVAFSVAYRPAAGLAAGGDFYDVFELDPNRTALLLGDVSGHGRESVAQAALVRFTLRTFIAAGHSPAQAIALTDPCLDAHMDGHFATVIAAVYDHKAHTLTYAKAGHHPPLVLGFEDSAVTEELASPPIGAGLAARPHDIALDVPAGATVCFFTDGLVETRRAGAPLGSERVQGMLADAPHDAEALLAAVAAEADELNDDLAVCLLHRPTDDPSTGAATQVGEPITV
jgi:stage II sporulation SpoE-like protein